MIINYILCSLFAIWFVLSVIRQVNPKFQYRDTLDLLPNCRFFAPRPLSQDFRLYILPDDGLNQASLVFDFNRKWYSFLWNDKQKINKTINDLISTIIVNHSSKRYDLSYMILLNVCNTIAIEKGVERFKFSIYSYAGFEEATPNLIFESNIHKTDKN